MVVFSLLMLPLTKAKSKSSGNGGSRTGDVCLRLWEYDGAGIKNSSREGQEQGGLERGRAMSQQVPLRTDGSLLAKGK